MMVPEIIDEHAIKRGVGDTIAEARVMADLTQKNLAAYVGRDVRAIRAYEDGDTLPTLYTVAAIALVCFDLLHKLNKPLPIPYSGSGSMTEAIRWFFSL